MTICHEGSHRVNSSTGLHQAPWPVYTVTIVNEDTNETTEHECEALLNATGRTPNVFGMGLEHVMRRIYVHL